MEFRPCPAPFSRYEISKCGRMRIRRIFGSRRNLKPYFCRGGCTYAVRKDDNKNTTVTVDKMVNKVWPEYSFRSSARWHTEVVAELCMAKSGAPQKASRPIVSSLPVDYDLSPDCDIDWRDANYCPMG